MSENLTLFISTIRTDVGTQMRAGNTDSIAKEYAEDMQKGDIFPPVEVFFNPETGEYILINGFNRVAAAKIAEFTRIDAVVVGEGNESDAVWASLKANAKNSLRRTSHDREKAIQACIEHPNSKGFTEEQIAEATGTNRREVFRVRKLIGAVKNPERKRDLEFEAALGVIRADCPKLADSISMGIVDLPRDETIRLAGKEDNERKALLPVMEDRRLTLKQAEKVVRYIPSDESLPLSIFLDYWERNPEEATMYFRNKTIQLDATVLSD